MWNSSTLFCDSSLFSGLDLLDGVELLLDAVGLRGARCVPLLRYEATRAILDLSQPRHRLSDLLGESWAPAGVGLTDRLGTRLPGELLRRLILLEVFLAQHPLYVWI